MKVISVLNQKGGVAKTTSVYNISAVLAKKGYRVLMIDNDGQASLTLSCGIDPRQLKHSMIDVYLKTSKIKDCIVATKVDNLDLAPADIRLSSQETKIFNEIQRESILKNALRGINRVYDYVLIDNPPHLGIINVNSLISSDFIIVPCEATPMSTYAMDDMAETIESMKEFNPSLKMLGVIVTRYNKIAKVQQKELNYLENNYNVLGIIKRSTEAEKPLEEGVPAVVFDEKTDVAKQYLEVTNKIIDLMGEEK